MLAIEGPTVINFAPSGMFVSIQWPASRPPGNPPEPARNVSEVDGCTCCQAGINNDNEITPVATGASHELGPRMPRMKTSFGGDQVASVRAARIATAGAMGSRY